MKKILLPVLALAFLVLGACSSVKVMSDYDRQANFNGYQSYAFYKTGIDKAQISDLDKKRILRAIEAQMAAKGFQKSNNPDLVISIFTKEREQVDIYNNYWGAGYWGWGWNPYYWGGPYYGGNSVSTSTEGSLYIDLIDSQTKQLVWQGKGVGTLSPTQNMEKKEARINEFVSKILEAYPPEMNSGR